MRVTIDSAGRLVVPKNLRTRLGLEPGAELEINEDGGGLHLAVVAPGSQLKRRSGRLIAVAGEGVVVTDEDVQAARCRSAVTRGGRPVIAVDTSVAVPLVLGAHEHHRETVAALGPRLATMAGHAAFETYAVLTRLPAAARLTSADAATLLGATFVGAARGASPDPRALLEELAPLGIGGGATYDALVGAAARSADLPLLTRHRRALRTYAALGVAVELVEA